MYLAVLDTFPDFMTPTLIAHACLGAHLNLTGNAMYDEWLTNSFRKVVVRVDQKQFNKILNLDHGCPIYKAHEKHTLNGETSCLVTIVDNDNIPKVLKFSQLWKPSQDISINVDGIVDDIITTFSEEEKQQLINLNEDELVGLHHTMGQWIRNHYSLWSYKWKPVMVDGVDTSKNHPDEVSFQIIKMVHKTLRSTHNL